MAIKGNPARKMGYGFVAVDPMFGRAGLVLISRTKTKIKCKIARLEGESAATKPSRESHVEGRNENTHPRGRREGGAPAS